MNTSPLVNPSRSYTRPSLWYVSVPLCHVLADSAQTEGILEPEEVAELRASYKAHLDGELAKSSDYQPKAAMLEGQWKGLVWPASPAAISNPDTGVDAEVLQTVGKASVTVPEGFVRTLLCSRMQFSNQFRRNFTLNYTDMSRTVCNHFPTGRELTLPRPR